MYTIVDTLFNTLKGFSKTRMSVISLTYWVQWEIVSIQPPNNAVVELIAEAAIYLSIAVGV